MFLRRSMIWFLLLTVLAPFFAHADSHFCGTPNLQAAEGKLASPLVPVWSAPPAQVGETLRFFTHIPDGEIRAVTRAVREHIAIHVDNAHTSKLSDALLRQLADEFERRIYPRTHEVVGPEWSPGIDRDPRVHLLIHDVEENGSAQGFGGYFSQTDLVPTAYHSNRREMISLDVFGVLSWGRTKLFATFAHEFAHLASWYQNGGSTDELWLEEGMASFDEWVIYGNIHWIFVDGFFASPWISLTSSGSFESRYGAGFLLLLYLYERYGGLPTIRAISAENLLGIAGVERALTQLGHEAPFARIIQEWSHANLSGGYRHLPAGKQIAATAIKRVRSYPTESHGSLADWQAHALRLEQLPPRFRLSFETDAAGRVYLATARSRLDASPQLLAMDGSNSGEWVLSAPNDGERILHLLLPLGGHYTLRIAPTEAPLRTPEGSYRHLPIPPVDVQPLAPRWLEATSGGLEGIVRAEGFLQTRNIYHRFATSGESLHVIGDWGMERFHVQRQSLTKQKALNFDVPLEDLAVRDEYLYLGAGPAGVQIRDARTWALITDFAKGGYVIGTTLQEDQLHVLDVETGLSMWDIRVPDNARLLGRYRPQARSYALEMVGDVVYLATAEGLQVVDVAIPDRPQRLTTIEGTGAGLSFAPPYLYLLTGGNVRAFDLADPRNPRTAFTLRTPGRAHAVQVVDERLYVADGRAGLSVFGLGHTPPRLISRRPHPGDLVDLQAHADSVYLLDNRGSIEALHPDDTIPSTRYITQGRVTSMVQDEEVFYLGTEKGGIAVVSHAMDVPLLRNQFQVATSEITALAYRSPYLYLATGERELMALSVPEGRVKWAASLSAVATDLSISGSELWIAADTLQRWDLSQPTSPRMQRSVPIQGHALRLATDEETIFVAALDGGVSLVERETGVVQIRLPANANHVSVDQEAIYIADSEGLLRIYDRETLTPTGTVHLTEEPIAVIARSERAYVLARTSLMVVHLKRARVEQMFGDFEWAEALQIHGDRMWVADVYGLARLHSSALPSPSAVEGIEDAPRPMPDPDENGVQETHPPELVLGPNFPNPANPETWLPYELPEATSVRFEIHDLSGRLIRGLDLGVRQAGSYMAQSRAARWDGRNDAGEVVASGVYFYTIEANGQRQTGRLLLQR